MSKCKALLDSEKITEIKVKIKEQPDVRADTSSEAAVSERAPLAVAGH